MSALLRRLTYANVMSTLAMFLVLGGGAYAASTLPRNSVGARQIKPNAVSSSKIKDGSLQGKDFKPGQLPAGATGPAGARGPAGGTGPTGATGATGATPAPRAPTSRPRRRSGWARR